MKTDLYTKIVLTVIAVCLSIIVLRSTQTPSLIPNAIANSGTDQITKVEIVAISDNLHSESKALPVRVVNSVNITK
jgi:hypothetical protein